MIVEAKHIDSELVFAQKINPLLQRNTCNAKIKINGVYPINSTKKLQVSSSFTRYNALDEVVKVSEPANLTFMLCSDYDNIEMDSSKAYKRNFKTGDFLGPFTVSFEPDSNSASLDYTATVEYKNIIYDLSEAVELFKISTVDSICIVRIETSIFLKGTVKVNCPTKIESNIHVITKSSPVQAGKQFVYKLDWYNDEKQIIQQDSSYQSLTVDTYPVINTHADAFLTGFQGKNKFPVYGSDFNFYLEPKSPDIPQGNIILGTKTLDDGTIILPKVYISYSNLNYLENESTWNANKHIVLGSNKSQIFYDIILSDDYTDIESYRYHIKLGDKEQYNTEGSHSLNVYIYIDFSLSTHMDLDMENNGIVACNQQLK